MTKLSNESLLDMAIEFNCGVEPIVNGRLLSYLSLSKQEARRYSVSVRNMGSNADDGPDKWAILKDGGSCLNKHGKWERQGFPSSRDDNFYERCRFNSEQKAIAYYRRWRKKVIKWAKEQLGDRDPKTTIINYPMRDE